MFYFIFIKIKQCTSYGWNNIKLKYLNFMYLVGAISTKMACYFENKTKNIF